MRFEASGISFSHPGREILRDVSFSIDSGEVLAILGPNGAGKTTLLRCLNRVYSADGGTVTIGGEDTSTWTPRRRAQAIAYVPQRSNISGSTVFESVLLGRKPYIDWDLTDWDVRLTSRVIDIMGLSDLSERNVDTISGGEYQLVQIARAIVQQPDVIVLDEPTNNLDITNQSMVMRALRDLVKGNDLCAVMANHDINLSARYADRFLFLKGGEVHAFGGREVITAENIEAVYGLRCDVVEVKGNTIVIPE